SIYDPKVEEAQIWMDLSEPGVDTNLDAIKKQVTICDSAYTAAEGADCVVIATEWDEFRVDNLDYKKIYDSMQKPAFLFDGRLILDSKKLQDIGFQVEVIGKGSTGAFE